MPNLNSGEPWSEMDLEDLHHGLQIGTSVEELADFLCRDVEEVRQKIAEAQAMKVPRGKYRGRRVGKEPADESEHFMRCPRCGGLIDKRDLGQVFEHQGPLPHSAEDQPQ